MIIGNICWRKMAVIVEDWLVSSMAVIETARHLGIEQKIVRQKLAHDLSPWLLVIYHSPAYGKPLAPRLMTMFGILILVHPDVNSGPSKYRLRSYFHRKLVGPLYVPLSLLILKVVWAV